MKIMAYAIKKKRTVSSHVKQQMTIIRNDKPNTRYSGFQKHKYMNIPYSL